MTCLHGRPSAGAALSAAGGIPRRSKASAVPGRWIRGFATQVLWGVA